MSQMNIFLGALVDYWRAVVSVMTAFVLWLTIWPRVRDSIMGKLLGENRKLKKVLGQMTIEETLKIDIIADLQKQTRELEDELLRQHRRQVDELHQTKDPESPAR
jgi:hypothetical protein